MTEYRRPLLAANWKMHGTEETLRSWCRAFTDDVHGDVNNGVNDRADDGVEMVFFPPFVWLYLLRELAPPFAWGAQTLGPVEKGACTGEVSAQMLSECGCDYVLVAHSERRQMCGENDQTAARRCQQALAAGLQPVLCVGEKREERDAGQSFSTVQEQLRTVFPLLAEAAHKNMVIAYEPVWAIGAARCAESQQIEEMHAFIRSLWREHVGASGLRILYGGSVNEENAAALAALEEVDGVLVGGASLSAQDFSRIRAAFARAPVV